MGARSGLAQNYSLNNTSFTLACLKGMHAFMKHIDSPPPEKSCSTVGAQRVTHKVQYHFSVKQSRNQASSC